MNILNWLKKRTTKSSYVSKRMTAKEAELKSAYYYKQAIKYGSISDSLFSIEEKQRATTCKEGYATTILHDLAIMWITKYSWNNSTVEDCIKNRPNTKRLLKSNNTGLQFFGNTKYFNIYFASWYYKLNWENIVKEVFNAK